jgi:diaminopimelate decarboxylase
VKANDVTAIVARLTATEAPGGRGGREGGREGRGGGGRVGGLGANVVSRGEWAIARRAGVPNQRITLEGIGKTDADLRAAVRAAVAGEPLRWIALESADEAAALAAIAARATVGRPGAGPPRVGHARSAGGRRSATRLDVLLRLNPDVTPETHAGLAVGAGSSKFGMSESELGVAIEAGGGPDGPLRWRGIHLHVGSQLGAVDAWRDAVRRALALLALLRGGLPDLDTLDVGGGFPVAPSGSHGPDGVPSVPSPARFAREVTALLAALPPDRRPARLAIEPGRFLVARSGWLVGRVLHVRDRGGDPLVVIDTGMTELIRPALYGAHHPIVALTSLGVAAGSGGVAGGGGGARGGVAAGSRDLRPTRVEGPICESSDALGVHDLPPLVRGDLVAIADAGAYGTVLGSSYNGRPRPPQVLLESDGRLTLVRRRGSTAALG